MLNFNSKKFDFFPVYDRIKHFYPIGVKKNEGGLYYSYPGITELDAIVADNIHNEKHYEDRWVSFTREMKLEINKEIIGTTYGNAPSFSGYVLLNKMSIENLTRTKELHFCVSLIGPYYTIIGEDTNMVSLDDKLYKNTNYLVVSPQGEFAEIFENVSIMIENQFKGYRFIPYAILSQTIEGLTARYSDGKLDSVFNALFNNLIELKTWKIIGNTFYKSEDWLKEGYVDDGGGWKANPPKE